VVRWVLPGDRIAPGSLAVPGLILILGRPVGLARNRRLSGWLLLLLLLLLLLHLLLHLQLPLLHLLQHLLRRLHSRLFPRIGRLFGLYALIGIVVRILLRRFRVRCVRRLRRWLPHIRGFVRSRWRLLRWPIIVAWNVRPRLRHQHHARERARVLRRTKQHVVESRSIEQFCHDVPRQSRPQMRYYPLPGLRNLNLGPRLFAHGPQDIAQS